MLNFIFKNNYLNFNYFQFEYLIGFIQCLNTTLIPARTTRLTLNYPPMDSKQIKQK